MSMKRTIQRAMAKRAMESTMRGKNILANMKEARRKANKGRR